MFQLLPAHFIFFLFLFFFSGLLLLRSAELITSSAVRIANYLKWREFVIAFFVLAIGGSIPNLFIGLFSAYANIPELSFGDIVGNNVVDLTLTAALAVLLGQNLIAESRLAKMSSLLTVIVAVLPILLIFDGTLGRGDATALLLIFIFYSMWLLRKRHLYPKEFSANHEEAAKSPSVAFRPYFSFLYSRSIKNIYY